MPDLAIFARTERGREIGRLLVALAHSHLSSFGTLEISASQGLVLHVRAKALHITASLSLSRDVWSEWSFTQGPGLVHSVSLTALGRVGASLADDANTQSSLTLSLDASLPALICTVTGDKRGWHERFAVRLAQADSGDAEWTALRATEDSPTYPRALARIPSADWLHLGKRLAQYSDETRVPVYLQITAAQGLMASVGGVYSAGIAQARAESVHSREACLSGCSLRDVLDLVMTSDTASTAVISLEKAGGTPTQWLPIGVSVFPRDNAWGLRVLVAQSAQ